MFCRFGVDTIKGSVRLYTVLTSACFSQSSSHASGIVEDFALMAEGIA